MRVVIRPRGIVIFSHLDTIRIPVKCFVYPPNCASLAAGKPPVGNQLKVAVWRRGKYAKEIRMFPYSGICLCFV